MERVRRNGEQGRRSGGFTLIEVMVSLAVVIIGLLGIMALQTTTMRANRLSRGLERAQVLAAQIMEDLRAKPALSIPPLINYAWPLTPDNVSYTGTGGALPLAGSTLLILTATVSFTDDADGSVHSATVQLLRTTQEIL